MITMVEHGSKRINRVAVFTTPASVLAAFGKELSYKDIVDGLYLFEPNEQEKIFTGLKQKQFQFWNDIEVFEMLNGRSYNK